MSKQTFVSPSISLSRTPTRSTRNLASPKTPKRGLDTWQPDELDLDFTPSPSRPFLLVFWVTLLSIGGFACLWFSEAPAMSKNLLAVAHELNVDVDLIVFVCRGVAICLFSLIIISIYRYSSKRKIVISLNDKQKVLLGLIDSKEDWIDNSASLIRKDWLLNSPLGRRLSTGIRKKNISPLSDVTPLSMRQRKSRMLPSTPVSPSTSASAISPSPVSERLGRKSHGRISLEKEICNEKDLENYLILKKSTDQDLFYGSGSEWPFASQLELPQYDNFARYLTARIPSHRQGTLHTYGNEADPIAAEQLLDTLSIEPDQMEVWTEMLRRWINDHIMSPLISLIDQINIELLSNVPMLAQGPGTSAVTAYLSEASRAQSGSSSWNRWLLEYSASAKGRNLVQFLSIRGTSSREYLLHRIDELANGGSLPGYTWNRGGSWKGKPWTSDHPCDAEIIFHLICTFFDNILPSSAGGRPFTDRYVVVSPDSPESSPCPIKIHQTQIKPPHFKVIYGDSTWEILPGRNNMFHAVLLFLYCIKINYRGFLGQADLSQKHIDLMSIFVNYIGLDSL